MEAFRFRLARVLVWYRKRVTREEDRLRAGVAEVTRIDGEILHVQETRERIERDLIAAESLGAQDFLALGHYRAKSRSEEAELAKSRGRAEDQLVAQRAKVRALQIKVRLLEKLHERRLAEHVAAENHELEELAADSYRAASFRAGMERQSY